MQIIINGLISGSAIALLAVAFQMVYLPTRVFFLGLAGLYSLTPYLLMASRQAGLPDTIGIPATTAAVVVMALLCEWLNHARLARKGASEGVHLISSLGIYILTVQIIAMVWGNNTHSLRTETNSMLRLGQVILTKPQLFIVAATLILLPLLWITLRQSSIGVRLRALADNPSRLGLLGYNLGNYRLLAFGFAGVFAAASSLLSANDLGFDPYSGLDAVLIAVVAVIIGGRFSFFGPAVGGLLLGVIRAQVVWQYSARWQEAVTFAVLAIFLLFRPEGLRGSKTRLEAAA